MSSTQVTPAPATPVTAAPKQTEFAKIFAFLGAHLILTALIIAGSIYGVEKLIAAHDATEAAKYATIFTTQQTALAQEQTQLATDEKTWQAQIASILTQNASLAKSVVSRDTQSTKQIAADATLTTTGAATQLTAQTNAAPGEVTATATGVNIDLPITRIITADLDQLVTTKADLADTKTQLIGETAIATDAQTDAEDQKKIVSGLNAQLDTQVTACKTQVASIKSAARKSKFKLFFEGVGVGIGVTIGVAIHGV